MAQRVRRDPCFDACPPRNVNHELDQRLVRGRPMAKLRAERVVRRIAEPLGRQDVFVLGQVEPDLRDDRGEVRNHWDPALATALGDVG
ncbi:MAG TPA: hypothetical protein VMU39_08090 [Solirubrobacteraceae bacterium]|nr:hypothetical protein [Solirubrobacteraceae bacterium]